MRHVRAEHAFILERPEAVGAFLGLDERGCLVAIRCVYHHCRFANVAYLAGVLLEDAPGMSFRDGLLGMTFLSRFNVKIDLKNGKIALEKLN